MSTTKTMVAAVALALGGPTLARAADAPAMPGQVVGRSAIPPAVDGSLTRETAQTGNQIGRIRMQTRGDRDVYSADLVGRRAEVVTLDSNGHVLSRQPY